MIGKIKTLGLAVVAVAAMSAFAVPAAQAGELDIGVTPASLFGSAEEGQTQSLVLQKTNSLPGQNEFPVNCSTATEEGTSQGQKVIDVTITATFSVCIAFGVSATVQMNGCKITITGLGQPANTGLIDITACTAGKTIEVKTAICTLAIGEQHGLKHVTFQNISSQIVTVIKKLLGLKVQQLGAACPDGNLHTGTNAKFTGNSLLVARADTGGTQVTKHSHQYQELSQTGAQTTLAST